MRALEELDLSAGALDGSELEVDILVVEDNGSVRNSILAILLEFLPDVPVASARNGQDALDFLFARGVWSGRAEMVPPKLILMDLSMPESNGFSVLGQIRSTESDSALKFTPVVVFSDSQAVADIQESYRRGANSYIVKPLTYAEFQFAVVVIGQYWMAHNTAFT